MANDNVIEFETVFRVSSSGAAGEIRLSADAWRVFTQINGSRTVRDIAANLKAEPEITLRAAEELLRLGLVAVGNQPTAPARATVNGAFFQNVEKEFVKVM